MDTYERIDLDGVDLLKSLKLFGAEPPKLWQIRENKIVIPVQGEEKPAPIKFTTRKKDGKEEIDLVLVDGKPAFRGIYSRGADELKIAIAGKGFFRPQEPSPSDERPTGFDSRKDLGLGVSVLVVTLKRAK